MKYHLPICLLLFSISAHGALNKWVDADGNVHYSDEPPPANAKVQKTLSVPPPASGAFVTKTISEREAELKKSQKSEDEAEKKNAEKQQVAAQRQKNCDIARGNIVTLEKSANIITYDASGKPANMDDAARKQSIEDNRKAVSEYCGDQEK